MKRLLSYSLLVCVPSRGSQSTDVEIAEAISGTCARTKTIFLFDPFENGTACACVCLS
eukprot:COSAG06_NODE_1952_length_7992_cov_4.274294_2_plen_58_part_00